MENNSFGVEPNNRLAAKNGPKSIDGHIDANQLKSRQNAQSCTSNVRPIHDRRVLKRSLPKNQQQVKTVNRPVVQRCTGKISVQNYRKRRSGSKKQMDDTSSMILKLKLLPEITISKKAVKKVANTNEPVPSITQAKVPLPTPSRVAMIEISDDETKNAQVNTWAVHSQH